MPIALNYSEKVVRKYPLTGNEDPRFFLGQEKTRLLKKGFEECNERWWRYAIEKLNRSCLEEFYKQLYIPFVQKKHNAVIHDLPERYTERIEKNAESDQIFFASMRNEKQYLVAWGIFISKGEDSKKKTASLGFRAYNEDIIIKKQKLWNFIEFMFYERAITHKHTTITRGQDRNGAGECSSAIGLALHKIEAHFLPFLPQQPNFLTIDTQCIHNPTLFFMEPNEFGQFTKALLYHAYMLSSLKEIQQLFKRRGIDLILV